MKNKISAAGYEAAAISAAIDMEKKAIEVYSNQAEISTDPNEKKLYNWLADWEKGHLKILSDLDNELRDKIWYDNHFWPF
jgi:rubrerythrin